MQWRLLATPAASRRFGLVRKTTTVTTVGCPTRPGPRQRSAARAVRVASIGIGHEADTPEALIAVNPSRPGRIYRDWSRCRHARSTDGGQPVNKLKFGSVGSRVGGHPLSPRHNVEVAPRRQKLVRPSVVAWSTLFLGVRGLQQWPTTELKFVDGWMSHRHVGHMTLMPQSHHSIAGMLVQALEVASRSLGIDTMSMARFTPFSRGKIVGKAEDHRI